MLQLRVNRHPDTFLYLVRVVRVDYPGQPEVSDLEQQLVSVDEDVGGLQISVQDVRRVDELQSPQQLVEQQRGVTCSRARGIRKHHTASVLTANEAYS